MKTVDCRRASKSIFLLWSRCVRALQINANTLYNYLWQLDMLGFSVLAHMFGLRDMFKPRRDGFQRIRFGDHLAFLPSPGESARM